MKSLIFLFTLVCFNLSFSQVGIGTTTPDASSMLDIESSTSGLLIPRMTEAQRLGITAPANGLLVYQTNTSSGFWYYNGSSWVNLSFSGAEKINDLADGKSDDDGTDNGSSIFLGQDAGRFDDSSDNQNTAVGFSAMEFNNTGDGNVAMGYEVLQMNNSGRFNVSIGYRTLNENTIGGNNVAIGFSSMRDNTEGGANIALGNNTLRSNTSGDNNIAVGNSAMLNAVNGEDNIAIGRSALYQATGSENIAMGYEASRFNTTGRRNIAIGDQSLRANQDGEYNIAIGYRSLSNGVSTNGNVALGRFSLRNNTADNNTAVGRTSMPSNTTGTNNSAFGYLAMFSNITGNDNVAVGNFALGENTNGSGNIAIGNSAGDNASGDNNVFIGLLTASSGVTPYSGDNNIIIGHNAQPSSPTASNEIRMGNTAITSARIQVPWTITSDERWKSNITQIKLGLDFLNNIEPVEYNRKSHSKTKEIGFIAQQVAQVLKESNHNNYGLLSKDQKGFYELRYNDFIGILVNATKEQQQIITSQKQEIEVLKERLSKIELLLENKI